MTFDQFIYKHLGEKVDFDGSYGGQCVDLYRQYCKDVLNAPQSPASVGAYQIWDNYLKTVFTATKYEFSKTPNKGDVVVWNKNEGKGFGHVAICIESNSNGFTSLDQNWPTLSKVTKTPHDYKNVIGWLRPIKEIMPDTGEKTLQEKLAFYEVEYPKEQNRVIDARRERDAIQSELDTARQTWKQAETDFKSKISGLETENTEQKNRYKELITYFAQTLGTTQDEAKIKGEVSLLLSVEDSLTAERSTVAGLQIQLRTKEEIVSSLQLEVERLKNELKTAKGLGNASDTELLVALYESIIKRLKALLQK